MIKTDKYGNMKLLLLITLLSTISPAGLIEDGLGQITLGQIDKATDSFTKSCNSGNAKGCLSLGAIYMTNHPRDSAKGLEAFKMSCDSGNAMGCKQYKQFSKQGK